MTLLIGQMDYRLYLQDGHTIPQQVFYRINTLKQGFSLVELIVTMAILSIILGVLYGNYSTRKADIDAVSNETQSFIRLIQEQSISSYTKTSVSLNITALEVHYLSYREFGKATNTTYTPDDSVSIFSSLAITELIFSPTQSVQAKFGHVDVPLTEPLVFSFSYDGVIEKTLSLYPTTGRFE